MAVKWTYNRKPGEMLVVRRATPCGERNYIVAIINEAGQAVLTESCHSTWGAANKSLREDFNYNP